jgi:hypothetical protein
MDGNNRVKIFMKHAFLITIVFTLTSCSLLAQNAEFVKGKGYTGYIFPKEHSIWGFPPEQNRYTPSSEDIAQAEKILQDSIETDYVKSNQQAYRKLPINKRTLKNYLRQYVGYITDNNEIIIWINFLHKREYCDEDKPKDADKIDNEIIMVLDGSYYFWHISINISTKELSDMQVNGIS